MGFYHKKVLENPATTVALVIGDKEWVCPLTENLNVSIQTGWESGGGLIDAFQQGIAEGANSAMGVARNVQNDLANIGNRFTGGASKGGVSFNGAEQGKLVTASDFYKKFKDSNTNFNLPSLVFTFINEDDTDKILSEAKDLMSHVIPLVSDKSNDDYRYEVPPNNFQTPNQGFDPSNITGSVGIRIGNRTLNYFVPTNASMKFSPECSLVDTSIPQYIEVVVSVEPAFKYMSPEILGLIK